MVEGPPSLQAAGYRKGGMGWGRCPGEELTTGIRQPNRGSPVVGHCTRGPLPAWESPGTTREGNSRHGKGNGEWSPMGQGWGHGAGRQGNGTASSSPSSRWQKGRAITAMAMVRAGHRRMGQKEGRQHERQGRWGRQGGQR